MLGLPKGEVFLMPWTEDWRKAFILEKEKIENEMGLLILSIHHIGSTAVEGLSAKPIIDIAIEIQDFNIGQDCAIPLERLGYSYRGVNMLPERHYFTKGDPRTYQIHMHQMGNEFLIKQLRFRDLLRSNEHLRLEYQKLKIELAGINQNNRQKYTDGKTKFITEALLENSK